MKKLPQKWTIRTALCMGDQPADSCEVEFDGGEVYSEEQLKQKIEIENLPPDNPYVLAYTEAMNWKQRPISRHQR